MIIRKIFFVVYSITKIDKSTSPTYVISSTSLPWWTINNFRNETCFWWWSWSPGTWLQVGHRAFQREGWRPLWQWHLFGHREGSPAEFFYNVMCLPSKVVKGVILQLYNYPNFMRKLALLRKTTQASHGIHNIPPLRLLQWHWVLCSHGLSPLPEPLSAHQPLVYLKQANFIYIIYIILHCHIKMCQLSANYQNLVPININPRGCMHKMLCSLGYIDL